MLEPTYWRERLRCLEGDDQGLFFTPKPDLSAAGTEVVAFRIRAHDGEILRGLLARPTWQQGVRPAVVRSVPAGREVTVDLETVRGGSAELVFEAPRGRALPDRVLDVVRVSQIALRAPGIDRLQIHFGCLEDDEDDGLADEYLIADRLLERTLNFGTLP
ncbi:MAG: hypothetical protein R3F49_16500 [Planctomycetota bacterium]